MSAMRCKIIICGTQSQSTASNVCELAGEIAEKPALSKKIIKAQDDYIKKTQKLLSELTR
jgi:hypothetical protein